MTPEARRSIPEANRSVGAEQSTSHQTREPVLQAACSNRQAHGITQKDNEDD